MCNTLPGISGKTVAYIYSALRITSFGVEGSYGLGSCVDTFLHSLPPRAVITFVESAEDVICLPPTLDTHASYQIFLWMMEAELAGYERKKSN